MATFDQHLDADFANHVATYRGFLRGVRMSVLAAAVLLVLMAYFLL